MDHVSDIIIKQIKELVTKKNKGGIEIPNHQLRSCTWVFVNCLIVNPTFDSQTKETMTLQVKKFGSKCNFSDKFMTSVSNILLNKLFFL